MMIALRKTYSAKSISEKTGEKIAEFVVLSKLYGRFYGGKKINNKRQIKSFEEENIPSAYKEAISFFIDKGIVSAKDMKGLIKYGASYELKISADIKKYIIEKTGENLIKAINEGVNLKKWLAEIDQMFDVIGLSELNPSYWQLVLRNASQNTFNQGKKEIFMEADEDEFPQIQYLTTGDNRVRPEHARLHKFTAEKNDPIWERITPPLDHWCRCTINILHKDEKAENSKNTPITTGKGFSFINKKNKIPPLTALM